MVEFLRIVAQMEVKDLTVLSRHNHHVQQRQQVVQTVECRPIVVQMEAKDQTVSCQHSHPGPQHPLVRMEEFHRTAVRMEAKDQTVSFPRNHLGLPLPADVQMEELHPIAVRMEGWGPIVLFQDLNLLGPPLVQRDQHLKMNISHHARMEDLVLTVFVLHNLHSHRLPVRLQLLNPDVQMVVCHHIVVPTVDKALTASCLADRPHHR